MRLSLTVCLSLLWVAFAVAQNQVTLKPPETSLQSLRDRVVASELADDVKTQTIDLIVQAEKQIVDAKSKLAAITKREAAIETVAQRVGDTKQLLAGLEDFKPSSAEGSLADLEANLATTIASNKAAKQALLDAESAMKTVVQRRVAIDTELPKLTSSATERKQQLENALTVADRSVSSDVAVAELRSSVDLLEATLKAMRSEKALLDSEAAVNLPQITRDLRAREAETSQQQLDLLTAVVESKRAEDAALRVEKATQQLEQQEKNLHPALRSIGKRNKLLAESNQKLTAKIEMANQQLSDRTSELEILRAAFDQASDRVKKVGLTDTVGANLRNLKQKLPSVGAYQLSIRDRAESINNENYLLMEMTDERNERMALAIDGIIRASDPPIGYEQRDQFREDARKLLQQQRTEFLDPAISSQSNYFNTLVSISTAEDEIVQLVGKSQAYIDEKVLWIRSTQPLYTHPVPDQDEWWFTLPAAWENVWSRLKSDVVRKPGLWIVLSLATFVLLLSRIRLRDEISILGEKAAQSSFTHFGPTIKACVWTIAIALPIPLAFLFLGNRLGSIAGSDRTLISLSLACRSLAYMYFPLEFARQVCRAKGLAESHFDWPSVAIAKVRRWIRILLWIAVPLSALTAFLAGASVGYGNDVLQRYLSLAAHLTLGVFVYKLAHPRRGAPARFLASNPDGWLNRLAPIWFPMMIAIPLVLAVLTIMGYHFTSQQIGRRFFYSLTLLFAIGVAVSLVMRWSTVHRRRLRMEQTKARRAAQQQKLAEQGIEAPSEVPIDVDEETPEELQEQMLQSRSLFRTAMITAAFVGLWLVWSDVVPALGFFEKWPLWTSTQTVTEFVQDDAGELQSVSREVPDPVTITEIGLAMLVILVAFTSARNLPGMLEFSVLRRLPLDRSIRYAITTLVSYLIVLVGLIAAGSTIGLHWNQIQWMATALTFGLAFGLQEMFANFVAGIIILFEQPVRVGDVVEIDGVTGVVSKIRIRATTITDWDRKDFIVPNKEFITGKLLNWTRSDEIVRIKVAVGVAYGSDTALARKLLLETANEHPDILGKPPVLATFDGFGDNSLNFTLRAFVNTYEKRFQIMNDLHMAIDRKFRDSSIEISFPQRDLHLRTLPGELTGLFKSNQAPDDSGQLEVDKSKRDSETKGKSFKE